MTRSIRVTGVFILSLRQRALYRVARRLEYLGALAGVIGVLQAVEAVKELLGIGDGLAGRLMIFDALGMEFRKVKVRKDPECALCGPNATITELKAYEEKVCEFRT